MSLAKELRELQDKRAKLEDESLSLKEHEKKLEERAKVLEQKMMEELRSKNDEARENIRHLESRISDLEQRLGQITQKAETNEAKDEIASQTSNLEVTENVAAEINPEMLDRSRESAIMMPANDSSTDSQECDSESYQDYKKKKHNFWEKHGY
jgi:chromosome segregation ATPase